MLGYPEYWGCEVFSAAIFFVFGIVGEIGDIGDFKGLDDGWDDTCFWLS